MELVKKEENIIAPTMPLVPQILANAMPTPVPQMQFDGGIIPNFFHNIKLGQLAKATEREAQIAENKRRYVESSLSMVENIVTFSGRLELAFKKIKHETSMMDITENRSQAELVQIQLKNMLLQGEVELTQIELQIKKKELEAILHGSEQT